MTRDAIVEVALRSVQANGRAGLALRDVARRLGVSLPTVQRHFATKDHLWRACVDASVERLSPTVGPLPPGAGAAPGPGTTRSEGVLAGYLRRQIERAAVMPGLTAAMSNDAGPGAQERTAYLAERVAPFVAQGRSLMETAVTEGSIRAVDPQAFLALFGFGLGSMASSREGLRCLFGIDLDDPVQRDAFVANITDLLLHGLLPRGTGEKPPLGPASGTSDDDDRH